MFDFVRVGVNGYISAPFLEIESLFFWKEITESLLEVAPRFYYLYNVDFFDQLVPSFLKSRFSTRLLARLAPFRNEVSETLQEIGKVACSNVVRFVEVLRLLVNLLLRLLDFE